MTKETEIILCIPGQWKDRSEIVKALTAANPNEYIFEGTAIVHIPTNEKFEVNIQERNSKLTGSFKVASQGRLNDADLKLIDSHSFIVYLIGKAGNMIEAEKTMNAGQAFISAGGLAMKVETSGKSFTKAQWARVMAEHGENKFYEAFIVLLRAKDKSVYSCGMHNLGLRDIVCDTTLESNQGTTLIRKFIFHLLKDKPEIRNGDVFSIYPKSPGFKIFEEKCKIYAKDDLFFNPFGMYRLQATK
jgi:Domain of unknown function (DUF4261)